MNTVNKWQRFKYLPLIPLGKDGRIVTGSKEHIALSRMAAAEGMVLLKNENKILPLKPGSKVALFGKASIDYVKGGGGSGNTNVAYVRNLCQAMKEKEQEGKVELFTPLCEEFSENPLIYYYLGVCYRKVQHYNKAIHNLNKSISIESGILEVVNELGLNYACLHEYEEAIKYFKKAFEASKEVDICTNRVMCYYNLGDMEQARLNLDIAKKLAPEDEIVIERNIES